VDEVVFVGGATLTLLVDDPAAPTVRPTDDRDLIVNASSWLAYETVGKRLRARGFEPDTSEGAPLCRWHVDDLKVDVMPTSAAILGFSNRWYPEAMSNAGRHELAPGLRVRVATAPYLVAMKLEAFAGRGGGDLVASHDLEDLLALVDDHTALVDEVESAEPDLRAYLAERIGALLDDEAFLDALPGHLAGDPASQARRPLVLERLGRIAMRQGKEHDSRTVP
jgi:hypothetical protein